MQKGMRDSLWSRVTRTLDCGGCGSRRTGLLYAMTNRGYVCSILAILRWARCHCVSLDLSTFAADRSFLWLVELMVASPPPHRRRELSLSRARTGCMSASQHLLQIFFCRQRFIYFRLFHDSSGSVTLCNWRPIATYIETANNRRLFA